MKQLNFKEKIMKQRKKIVASLLSFALVVQPTLFGAHSVYAELKKETSRKVDFSRPEKVTKTTTQKSLRTKPNREPKVEKEKNTPKGKLIKVKKFSKTYQVSKDKFITQFSAEPNTYKTKNGEERIIDNTLKKNFRLFGKTFYENTENEFKVKLPQKMDGNDGVALTQNGDTIELIPQGGDLSRSAVNKNMILYTDVYPGVDYQYTVKNMGIKEDIILNKFVNQYQFNYELKADGYIATEQDGQILLTKIGEKEPRFILSAPIMYDAAGEESISVRLVLKEKKGKQIITVKCDEEWLASPSRTYPVTIDPDIITVPKSSIGLYGAEQGTPDLVVGDNGYPYAGYDDGIVSKNIANSGIAHRLTRTYVDVNYDFSSIPKESTISKATFSLSNLTSWSDGKTVFGLYTVDKPWNSSITWDTQTGLPSTFVDSSRVSSQIDQYMNFDVTSSVNDWIQGIQKNNGFVVKSMPESNNT